MEGKAADHTDDIRFKKAVDIALRCMKKCICNKDDNFDDTLVFQLHFVLNQWYKTQSASTLNWTNLQQILSPVTLNLNLSPPWFITFIKQSILSMTLSDSTTSSFSSSSLLNCERIKHIEYNKNTLQNFIHLELKTQTAGGHHSIVLDQREFDKLKYQLAKASIQMKQVNDHPILQL